MARDEEEEGQASRLQKAFFILGLAGRGQNRAFPGREAVAAAVFAGNKSQTNVEIERPLDMQALAVWGTGPLRPVFLIPTGQDVSRMLPGRVTLRGIFLCGDSCGWNSTAMESGAVERGLLIRPHSSRTTAEALSTVRLESCFPEVVTKATEGCHLKKLPALGLASCSAGSHALPAPSKASPYFSALLRTLLAWAVGLNNWVEDTLHD